MRKILVTQNVPSHTSLNNSNVTTTRNEKQSYSQRQNAIFSGQKQVEKQHGAVQHLQEIQQLKENANELKEQLNSQKVVISEQIQILNKEVLQENDSIFGDVREKMLSMKESFLKENEEVYIDLRKTEELIQDVRSDYMVFQDQIAGIMAQLDINTLQLGYSQTQDEQYQQQLNETVSNKTNNNTQRNTNYNQFTSSNIKQTNLNLSHASFNNKS